MKHAEHPRASGRGLLILQPALNFIHLHCRNTQLILLPKTIQRLLSTILLVVIYSANKLTISVGFTIFGFSHFARKIPVFIK